MVFIESESKLAEGGCFDRSALSLCIHTCEMVMMVVEEKELNWERKHMIKVIFKNRDWDFPATPVVKILHFHCRGHKFDPW